MRPTDITVLFGNLFDNAIAACKECKEKRYIIFSMRSFHEMLSIKIENSINKKIKLKNGKITKEKQGIGTLNIEQCVDFYKGSIFYKCVDDKLICQIFLNEIN